MQARPIFIEYRRRRGFITEYQAVRTIERQSVKTANPLLRIVGKKQHVSSSVSRTEMMLVQRTADVTPDWVATVKTTIESAARTIDGQPAPFSREDDPTTTYLSQKVDRFGKMVDQSGTSPVFLTGVFPDRSLRSGETWEIPTETSVPKFDEHGNQVGSETVDLVYLYTLVGQQKVDKYQCAEVQVAARHQSYVNETTLHQYSVEGSLLFAHRDGFLVQGQISKLSRLGTAKSTQDERITDFLRLLKEGNEEIFGR